MIRLARIVLVNWYAFGAQDIDLRGSAAIIGPNGAGKSSLLDAVQVVLTGNNSNLFSLNASSNVTSGRGRAGRTDDARSVFHYCVGRVHNEVLRRECITYLALVFERERDGRRWTVGLGLSAREEDGRAETLGAFIAPDQSLRAVDFLQDLDGGGRGPLPYDELMAKLKRSAAGFENFGHRPTLFTRQVLLALRGRHGHAEPDRFLQTIKNALRFREMSSANDFVRNFILDEDLLDVDGLRASVAAWRGFQEAIEKLERQKVRVEEVIAQFVELLDKAEDERRFRWIARRAESERLESGLGSLRRQAEAKRAELDELDRTLARTREVRASVEDEVREIRAALATDSREIAIGRFGQVELPVARRELHDAAERRDARLRVLASGLALDFRLILLPGADEFRASKEALTALGSRMRDGAGVDARSIDAVARRTVDPLSRYERLLQGAFETVSYDLGRTRSELREARDQLRDVASGGAPIRRETRLLIARLEQAGIEARPLAELVEVLDEDWRAAAETMLGAAREALIVDPADARRGIEILRRDRRDHYGCQVVNTTRTGRVQARPAGDSLAAVIATDDPHARAFVNTRLNGIVRVDSESELLRVDRGVTADCLSASGGSIEARRPAADHLLGSDARERNRPLLETRVSELERDLDRYGRTSRQYEALRADLNSYLQAAGDPVGYHELEAAVAAAGERVHAIEDNIRTLEGERPTDIRQRLADLESDLKGHREDETRDGTLRDGMIGDVRVLDARVVEAAELHGRAASDFANADASFDDHAREAAMRDFRNLLAEFGNPAAVRNAADAEAVSANRRAVALSGSAPQLARQFAYDFEVPGFELGRAPVEQLAWLRAQLAAIEGNHLVRYKEQAARALAAIEESLRSDLLIKLYTKLEGAKEQIGTLNKLLKARVFHGERYEFDWRPDPGLVDIVQVAKRVYDNDADVMAMFEPGAELDGELARGVDRIRKMLEGGEDVSEVGDYRKYLHFELVTRRLEDGKQLSDYSRRQQSGSGGEKQVPFYIAISSAIAATCHHRETVRENMGLGLALFDEAFNALDGGNVGSCLAMMGEFNLQVVACAPTEKLATFMEHMDTIVTINRDRTRCQIDVEYTTAAGRERFREANPANMTLDEFRELRRMGPIADAAE